MEDGNIDSRPLSVYVQWLKTVGQEAEARAFLVEMIAREAHQLGKLKSAHLARYLGDAALAFTLIGDAATARSYAERATAALSDVRPAEQQALAAREIASALLEAGMPDHAEGVLQKALSALTQAGDAGVAQQRASELQRLMLRTQMWRKNEAGAEAARAALLAFRRKAVADDGLEAISDRFGDDFRAALEAGDRGEAQRIRDEALALLSQAPKSQAPPESELRATAEMQAALGDDEGAIATLRKVEDDSSPRIPSMMAYVCQILSRNGHIVPALRCAAQLTDKRPDHLQRRFETYAKIAADMAR
jgi:tetratricopeptide (TPR) repeat protein